MNNLIKIQSNGQSMLVDSRLIAQELGINHRHWKRNIIDKYLQVLENEFGKCVFKTHLQKGKGGNPTVYALLNEDQAYFLLVLSRNSERVVKCKAKLVKSFQAARRQLQQLHTPPPREQVDPIDFMALQNQVTSLKSSIERLRIEIKHNAVLSAGSMLAGKDSIFFEELYLRGKQGIS